MNIFPRPPSDSRIWEVSGLSQSDTQKWTMNSTVHELSDDSTHIGSSIEAKRWEEMYLWNAVTYFGWSDTSFCAIPSWWAYYWQEKKITDIRSCHWSCLANKHFEHSVVRYIFETQEKQSISLSDIYIFSYSAKSVKPWNTSLVWRFCR